MNNLFITATLLVSTLTFARAENTVTVAPVNYLQMQKEMKRNAQLAAGQAEVMARLAGHDFNSAANQRIHAADLKKTVNETLERASTLAMSLPYETFDSAEGNQLMQSITELSRTTQAAIVYLNESPRKVQSGEYIGMLNKIRDLCEELAE